MFTFSLAAVLKKVATDMIYINIKTELYMIQLIL